MKLSKATYTPAYRDERGTVVFEVELDVRCRSTKQLTPPMVVAQFPGALDGSTVFLGECMSGRVLAEPILVRGCRRYKLQLFMAGAKSRRYTLAIPKRECRR